MRLAWATDIHLNFLDDIDRRRFFESIKSQADAFVVTGDIAESKNIVQTFREMDALLGKPVYFVLGNHDFYHGSVANTRREVAKTAVESKNLIYLSQAGIVELASNTALVGHDGWADARLGDFDGSRVILNDFLLIDELRHWKNAQTLDKPSLRQSLQMLGDEAARYLKTVLTTAANQYPHVIVATHVPPFREASWHEGRPSSDDYLPYFSCKAVGNVLLAVAQAHPKCHLLVLCGHTHSGGKIQISENLSVLTGPAEYGNPQIQRVFDFE